MRAMRFRFTILAALAALALSSVEATAYFELELESGGTMVAESYVEEGDSYRLYRPGGELRIDKARVRAIRERDGSLVETAAKAKPSAPAKPVAAPVQQAAAPAPLPEGAELEALERKLTRDIILGHRDLLFARNRGEDVEELKRRKKEVERLEDRRERVQTKLGPR